MTMRIVPEDQLTYARNAVMAWCSKAYPHMTLGQVQHLAILIAVERQKAAAAAAADTSPRRERRICNPDGMPVVLPAPVSDDDDTNPRAPR